MVDSGSTRPKLPGVTEIFAEYVRLRQRGSGQQDALNYLKPMLERLNLDARQQLVALLRSWEAREGGKYQLRPKAAAFEEASDLVAPPRADEDTSWLADVQSAPPPGAAPAAPALNVNAPVHPAISEPSTTIRMPPLPAQPPAPPAASEQQSVFYCPACGKANRLGDAYCYACGSLLNVASVQTRSLEQAEADLVQAGQAYFGQSSSLLLNVRGAERPIYVKLQDGQDVVLGRTSSHTGALPDIDLTPYRAAEQGVSRSHARLRCQDNAITITDLGSVNYTYVNGQRLYQNEVRVLRDGDEVRLGRLVVHVAFHHTVSRLK